jgi:hypothetical protein
VWAGVRLGITSLPVACVGEQPPLLAALRPTPSPSTASSDPVTADACLPGLHLSAATPPQRAPWLDGRHQVVGHVLSGMDAVERAGRARVDGAYAPLVPITIKASGDLGAPAGAGPGAGAGAGTSGPGSGSLLTAGGGGGGGGGVGATEEAGPAAPRAAPAAEPERRASAEGAAPAGPAGAAAAAPQAGPGAGLRLPPGSVQGPVLQLGRPGDPAVTRLIYMDLEQGGINLGRIIIGL